MKFLVYSDLQAHDGPDRCYHDPTLPLQRWRVQQFYRKVLEIFEQGTFTNLLDLGDTFDRRDALSIGALDAVLAGLEPLVHHGTLGWKLQGNHDQTQKYNVRLTNGRVFKHLFNVVDDIVCTQFGRQTGVIMAAFPPTGQTDYVKRLKRAVQDSRNTHEKTIVLGHFTVIGARLNSGIATDGIPLSAIEDADLVLLGDIHKPQSLAEHIHYVGSPFQQNFGEAGEEKRVGLLDTASATVDWIPLEGFPRYIPCLLPEFLQSAREDREDRYRVTLRTHEEAEVFAAHPLSARAEAVYSYENADTPAHLATEWTSATAMRRWVDLFTPESKGIPLSVEEMLSYGEDLTR